MLLIKKIDNMIKIDVNGSQGVLFSVNAVSMSAYKRREKLIEQLLHAYLWEYKTTILLDEMKQKVQYILDSDIKSMRKEKLERIAEIYNLPKYKTLGDGLSSIDIKFVIGNEFNFD